MKTLINLIGGQTIPNLIAQKFVQPHKIILVFTKGSVKQKENYKNISPEMTFQEIEIEPYDYDSITNITSQIVNNNSDEIILNFTGGTKIMSLASFSVFDNKKLLSIYIDSENGKIYKYKSGLAEIEEMNIKITLEEYLKLNGHIYQISDDKKVIDSRKEYYEYLENNYNLDISKFLDEINQRFEANKHQFYHDQFPIESGSLKYSWDNLRKISIIELNGHKFTIAGKDSIKYLTGLWFEDLVFYKKFYGTKYYNEILRNIHLQDKRGKQNMIELDIVGLVKNNFHLFELKSGKPRREALNNLRTIKEQLGTYTKLFLISYFGLEENSTLVERMQDLQITYYKYSDFELANCFEHSNINL